MVKLYIANILKLSRGFAIEYRDKVHLSTIYIVQGALAFRYTF